MKLKTPPVLLTLSLLVSLLWVPDTIADERLRETMDSLWSTYSGGSVDSRGDDIRLQGTLGQPLVEPQRSDSAVLRPAYWQSFLNPDCCRGQRGDIDGSGDNTATISDVIYLVDFFFGGGPYPVCPEEADLADPPDGSIDIADLVYLIEYMFQNGPPPAPCP